MRNGETNPKITGLNRALAVAGTSAEFEERCRQAALRGWRTRRLRAEKERMGFRRVSFVEYLKTLAMGSGIDADQVLRGFGISDLATPKEGRLAGWLARRIGIPRSEFLEQVRIGLSKRFGDPMPVLDRETNSKNRADAALLSEASIPCLSTEPETAAMIQSVLSAAEEEYDQG
ncbi:MAG: hypothetical protein ABSH49_27235 [Bryobacteraceae bacterium]